VRQLRQRVSLWCRTQALTESQTHAYVTERLRIAGASWQLFSDEALDLVHRFSRGIPRIINLLCEHSLILAYVEQVQQVNTTIVESVAAELELDVQPFMLSSAALGNGKPLSPRSETEDNFIAAFNRESPGRQGR
jgi:Holliday junction resolvasome RuvABC ATP-dependent DNA helicase subunit